MFEIDVAAFVFVCCYQLKAKYPLALLSSYIAFYIVPLWYYKASLWFLVCYGKAKQTLHI